MSILLFSKRLQNLIGVPKPLLPVASKPLITHWADLSDPVDAIDQIVVVTNGHFFGKLDHWKAGVKSSKKGENFRLLK